MSQGAHNWIHDPEAGWTTGVPINKIDTHHHYVPDFYRKAVEDAGGDPSGWPTPQWSVFDSQLVMEKLGIRTAVLSVTAPGACILKGPASFELARKLNEHGAEIRDKHPDQFRFFASLPSLLDTEAALKELEYALDTLHADGVTLFTRYGDGNAYLGNEAFKPIWRELNRRKCVVFVHPTHPVDTNLVNSKMPQPLIDYPHETTRTAMDMITQGTRAEYPDCKVILSHAGGTLPYLISRATSLAKAQKTGANSDKSSRSAQGLKDFQSFYFDITLSSSPQVLKLLFDIVPQDHILYGSDFPYAPPISYPAFSEMLETTEMDQSLRDKINFRNAQNLFSWQGGEGASSRL